LDVGPPAPKRVAADFHRPAGQRAAKPAAGLSDEFAEPKPPLVRNTSRQPDNPRNLPHQADVDDALSRTDFSDFTDALEDIHDNVRGWVGGDMGIVAIAAFDPVFWSHHAMIDRIWWIWQTKNGEYLGQPA
jgi:tyrosinase